MCPQWEIILQALWVKSRFTSYFYQSVHFAEDSELPTLSLIVTTTGLNLLYNPDFIKQYTNEELTGLLVHEMMHVILNHKHRIIPGNDVLLQNLAQDMVINTYIFENRKSFFSRLGRDIREEPQLVLPAGLPLIPEKYFEKKDSIHRKNDPSWEDVYVWLKANREEKIVDTTDGSEDDFSLDSRFEMPDFTFNKKEKNKEAVPDFFNTDDGVLLKDGDNRQLPSGIHFFRETSLDETVMALKKRIISFAARDENCRAERLYQEISVLINNIKPAKINNFNKKVKRFLNQALCSEDWGFSARRFNRRYFGEGLYAPGRIYRKRPVVTVAIDVSGSMVADSIGIEKAFGVIESLLRRYTVYLLCVDEEVFVPQKTGKGFIASENQSSYQYRKGDWKYLKTASNSATFFAPLFEKYMKDKKEPLIVITDGEIYDMDRLKPYKNTLWAVPDKVGKTLNPPFGKVAVIE